VDNKERGRKIPCMYCSSRHVYFEISIYSIRIRADNTIQDWTGLTGTIPKKNAQTSASLPPNLAGFPFNPSLSPSTGSSLALRVNMPEEMISCRSEERREW
jgi:hypothetical protein